MTDWPSNLYESAPGIRFGVDAGGVVRTTFSGRIGYGQIVQHLHAREQRGVLGLPQVVDAREATMELTTAEVQEFAALVRSLRLRIPVGPTAVVAGGDLAYGIGRMYSGFDDSEQFAVFRSIAEAEAWIAARQ